MRIGTPRIYSTTSNGTIKLSYQNPLILYNIKILALNTTMNTTFTITEQAGNQWSFNVTSGTEITFKKVNFSSIALSDPTTYNVFYAIQAVYADSYDELTKLEQESDVSIVPVDNVIITSPLDATGNVKTDINVVTQSGLNGNAFSNSLATANTKQALVPPAGYPTTAQAFLIIINLSPNDTIKVGDVNNQIIPLSPNQSLAIDIHKPQAYFNIASIYWIAATATTDVIGVIYA